MGVCAVILLMTGCKPGVPKEYIQPDDMEDILYDYHVADGMAYAEGAYDEMAFRRKAYREAALRKHGVTEAEFDSSLVYYYRHTERLHDIYANLSKRLNNDAIALGATANELSQFGGTNQGDTATVWRNEQAVVLMPQAPYNSISFEVKADTAYHQGDMMILSFDNQFIIQEGVRDGLALLAVTFDNDSTATQVTHINSDMHYDMRISNDGRLGIKLVKGFIYLGKGGGNASASPSTTLKIMCVNNMRLLRMHRQPPKEEESDSITVPAPHPAQKGGPPVSLHPQVQPVEGPPAGSPAESGPASPGQTKN